MTKKAKRKSWKDKKFFHIHVPVWNLDVCVSVAYNGKETYEKLQKITEVKKDILDDIKVLLYEYDTEGEEVKGRMFSLSGGYIVCIRPYKDDFRRTIALIVHEMTHVSHYILRDRRIPLSEDTEEAYAYLVEFLVKETLNKLY